MRYAKLRDILVAKGEPLRNAELVFGVFNDDSADTPPTLFFGKKRIEELAAGSETVKFGDEAIMVEMESRVSDEIEQLVAACMVIKGGHDYGSPKQGVPDYKRRAGSVKILEAYARRDDPQAINRFLGPIPRAGDIRKQIAEGKPFVTTRHRDKAAYYIVANDEMVACFTLRGVDAELAADVYIKMQDKRAWCVDELLAVIDSLTPTGRMLRVHQGGKK